MEWTEERVKKELPNIRVKLWDGHEADAQLSGRKLKFAAVTVMVHGSTLDTTASWCTIARVLSLGQPLRI